MKAETGMRCPATGFWRPGEDSPDRVFIFEESIMPSGKFGAISWHFDNSRPEPPIHPSFDKVNPDPAAGPAG